MNDPTRARLRLWGLRDYAEILALQEATRKERQDDVVADTWLVGEHPTVITQGVRGQGDDLLAPGDWPVHWVDRGGMATIHNPGQLVIYPIVKTRGGLSASARLSLMLLHRVRDWLLRETGVELTIPKGRPGLFFEERKAAAIGLSIHGGVSMHGIAINLCNDLTPWRAIVPCGAPSTRPTTLSEIVGRRIAPDDLIDTMPEWLRSAWGYETVDLTCANRH